MDSPNGSLNTRFINNMEYAKSNAILTAVRKNPTVVFDARNGAILITNG